MLQYNIFNNYGFELKDWMKNKPAHGLKNDYVEDNIVVCNYEIK